MNTEADNEKKEYGVETTGHEWDGIKELNNPLPRWWVWVFYACIIWGVFYTIAYPAWPLVNKATAGFLGFSTRAQVEEAIAEVEEQNAELTTKLASIEPVDLAAVVADDEALRNYAINGGGAIFAANCSQCHGSGANGVQAGGYPSLIDNDWLWGGTVEDIAYTVTHGIRNEQSLDARYSQMPAYGDMFSEEDIVSVVNYVMSLSDSDGDGTNDRGYAYNPSLVEAGGQLFYDNCAACHMDDGTGDRFQGAPNLTDAVWLYGGDEATLIETVTNARFGVMPAWSTEYRVGGGLTQDEINAVALYVHQLGGGE